MVASTLRKWRHNWKFLLATAATLFGTVALSQFHEHVMTPEDLPIHLRILGWPFLDIFCSLIEGFPAWGGFVVALPFAWSAFFWAALLLELKQVLARTFTRRASLAE
jgi:hypothetical protein